MKKLKYFNLLNAAGIFFLLFSPPVTSANAEIEAEGAIIIDAAIFGMMYKDSNGKWSFKETDRIPNRVGTPFRWSVHLGTKTDKVTWKEEFILPAPPNTWEGEEKKEVQVGGDRRASVMEKTVSPKDGWISNGWSISEGDPSGKYIMKVYVEGTFVYEFVFFVE